MGQAGKPRAHLIDLFSFHLMALGKEQLDITLGDILDQVLSADAAKADLPAGRPHLCSWVGS